MIISPFSRKEIKIIINQDKSNIHFISQEVRQDKRK